LLVHSTKSNGKKYACSNTHIHIRGGMSLSLYLGFRMIIMVQEKENVVNKQQTSKDRQEALR